MVHWRRKVLRVCVRNTDGSRMRRRVPLVASLAAMLLVSASLVIFNAEVVRKQEDNAAAQNVLSFRDGIWRMASVALERYPWFGVGMDNYSLVTPERVRSWRTEAGKASNAREKVGDQTWSAAATAH